MAHVFCLPHPHGPYHHYGWPLSTMFCELEHRYPPDCREISAARNYHSLLQNAPWDRHTLDVVWCLISAVLLVNICFRPFGLVLVDLSVIFDLMFVNIWCWFFLPKSLFLMHIHEHPRYIQIPLVNLRCWTIPTIYIYIIYIYIYGSPHWVVDAPGVSVRPMMLFTLALPNRPEQVERATIPWLNG